MRERVAKLREAQVVGAALKQRGGERTAERAGQQRNIARVELVLQRARAGRNEHAQPGSQRRHQVGKGLAGAGARLHQQVLALRHGLGDALGHAPLCRPRDETLKSTRQRPAGPEDVVHGAHAEHPK